MFSILLVALINVGDVVHILSLNARGTVCRVVQPGESGYLQLPGYPESNPIVYVRLDKPISTSVKYSEVEDAMTADAHASHIKRKLLEAEAEMHYYETKARQPTLEIGWQRAKQEADFLRRQYNKRREELHRSLSDKKTPILVVPVSALDIRVVERKKLPWEI